MAAAPHRVALVGAGSRLGRTLLARAGLDLLPIVRAKPGALPIAGALRVATYQGLRADDLAGCAALVYCLGAHHGTYEAMLEVNAHLAVRMANVARDAGISHMIYVSSFSVFGAATRIDADSPIDPTSDYGRSRSTAEAQLYDVAAQHAGRGPAISVLRVPMLYGHGASKLEKLIALARRCGHLPIVQGDVRRSMLHYESAALAIEALVRQPLAQHIVTLADETPFSYRLLADAAAQAGHRLALHNMPGWLLAAAYRLMPGAAASLFSDNLLSSAANAAGSLGLRTRLAEDVAHIFASGGGS